MDALHIQLETKKNHPYNSINNSRTSLLSIAEDHELKAEELAKKAILHFSFELI